MLLPAAVVVLAMASLFGYRTWDHATHSVWTDDAQVAAWVADLNTRAGH